MAIVKSTVMETTFKIKRDESLKDIATSIEKLEESLKIFKDPAIVSSINSTINVLADLNKQFKEATGVGQLASAFKALETISKKSAKQMIQFASSLEEIDDNDAIKAKIAEQKELVEQTRLTSEELRKQSKLYANMSGKELMSEMRKHDATAKGAIIKGNSQIIQKATGQSTEELNQLNASDFIEVINKAILDLESEKRKAEDSGKKFKVASQKSLETLKDVQGKLMAEVANDPNRMQIKVQLEETVLELKAKIAELERIIIESRAERSATKEGKEALGVAQHLQNTATQAGINSADAENQKTVDNLHKATDALDKNKTSVDGLTKSIFSAQLAMMLLRRAYRETLDTITQLDKAMNGIAIVSQYTTKQVWGMYDSFEGIAKRAGMTVKDISAVSLEFFRQGRSLSDVLKLTEAAATAAQIAGISATESVRYLTSAIQGYKLSADQAMAVSDKFAALSAASATDYEGLATALSKVASQASAVGVNMDSMMGFIAKALETTQEAPENIGTAFKTIFARMSEIKEYGKTLEDGMDINKIEKALRRAGVSLRDTNGEIKDLDKVLIEVGNKWDTLNRNTQTYITTALAGTRQQTRLLSVFENFDRTMELVNVSANSLGATYAQQSVYTESLAFSLNGLTVAWEGLISSVTSSEVFIAIIDTITDAITTVEKLNSALFGLPVILGITTIAVALLASKIKEAFKTHTGLIWNIAQLVGFRAATDGATSSTNKFTAALLANPVFWGAFLALAIGAATIAVIKFSASIKTTQEKVLDLNEEMKKVQATIFKNQQKTSGFKTLLKDIEELQAKLIKTTEDYKELDELLARLNDYGISDDGIQEFDFSNFVGDIDYDAIEKFLEKQNEELQTSYTNMKKLNDEYYQLIRTNKLASSEKPEALYEAAVSIEAMLRAAKDSMISTESDLQGWLALDKTTKEIYYNLAKAKVEADGLKKNFVNENVDTNKYVNYAGTDRYAQESNGQGVYKELDLNNAIDEAERSFDEVWAALEEKYKEKMNLLQIDSYNTVAETLASFGDIEGLNPDMIETFLKVMEPAVATVYKLQDALGSVDTSWTVTGMHDMYTALQEVGLEAAEAESALKLIVSSDMNQAIQTVASSYQTLFDDVSQAQQFMDVMAEKLFGTEPVKRMLEFANSMGSVQDRLESFFSDLQSGKVDIQELIDITTQYPQLWGEINNIMEGGIANTEAVSEAINKASELELNVLKEKAIRNAEYERDKLISEKAAIDLMIKAIETGLIAEDVLMERSSEGKLVINNTMWTKMIQAAELGTEAIQSLIENPKKSIDDIKGELTNLDLTVPTPPSVSDANASALENLKEYSNELQASIDGYNNQIAVIQKWSGNAEKMFGKAGDAAKEYTAKLTEIYIIQQKLANMQYLYSAIEEDRQLALAKALGLQNESLEIAKINNKYDLEKLALTQKSMQLYAAEAALYKSNQNDLINQMNKFGNVVDVSTGRAIVNFSVLNNLTGESREQVEELIEDFNKLADELEKSIANMKKQELEIHKMIGTIKKRNKEIEKLIKDLSGKQMLEAEKAVEDLILNAIKDREQAKIDALQKSLDEERKLLDERKKMYDEAFAEIDFNAEISDIDKQRSELQKQIAALATATDSTSVKKRKELQDKLDALNKDYNKKLQDHNRENLFKDEEDSLNAKEQEIADLTERLTNMSDFYAEMEALIAAGDDAIKEFLKANLQEYADATGTHKELLGITWDEILGKRQEIADEITALEEEYKNNLATLGEAEQTLASLQQELYDMEMMRQELLAQKRKDVYTDTKDMLTKMMSDFAAASASMVKSVNDITKSLQDLRKESETPITITTKGNEGYQSGGPGGDWHWKYATGGTTQRTGWHWLDGKAGAPERVLSPTQTQILDDMLLQLQSRAFGNNGLTIEGIQINVEKFDSTTDYRKAASSFAEELQRAMSNRGITTNQKR